MEGQTKGHRIKREKVSMNWVDVKVQKIRMLLK